MYKKYLLVIQVEVPVDSEPASKKVGARLIRAAYTAIQNQNIFELKHQRNLKITRILNPNDIEKLSSSIDDRGHLNWQQ